MECGSYPHTLVEVVKHTRGGWKRSNTHNQPVAFKFSSGDNNRRVKISAALVSFEFKGVTHVAMMK